MPLPEVDALFPDYAANRARGLCACCGKPIGPFRDALSEKEYGISGLRQECQDTVFGPPDLREGVQGYDLRSACGKGLA